MGNRIGKNTIEFQNPPKILEAFSLVGDKEGQGKFSKYFDKIVSDDKMSKNSFEKAECEMFFEIVDNVKRELEKKNKIIDYLIGGDLLNQNITTSFAARELHLPLIGIYSACATMAESLILGSSLIDGGFASTTISATVSHFSSAERQYRTPLEQGSQRPPQAQWTVTGGGALALGNCAESLPKIHFATIGEVIDYGITDTNNMGAAMAPAARSTLVHFFDDTKTYPGDYDLIVTGDLGKFGSDILIELMKDSPYPLEKEKYFDCGAYIYEGSEKLYQGGSGAGCSASVLASYIYKNLLMREVKNVIFVATGALLSTTSSMQGESIPGIAHLVEIEV